MADMAIPPEIVRIIKKINIVKLFENSFGMPGIPIGPLVRLTQFLLTLIAINENPNVVTAR